MTRAHNITLGRETSQLFSNAVGCDWSGGGRETRGQRQKRKRRQEQGMLTHEGKGRHGSMHRGAPQQVQPGGSALPEVGQVASQAG